MKTFFRVVSILMALWALGNAAVFVIRGWELDNGLAALGAGILAYAYQRPQMVAAFRMTGRPVRDAAGIILALSGFVLILAAWLVDPARGP